MKILKELLKNVGIIGIAIIVENSTTCTLVSIDTLPDCSRVSGNAIDF